MTGAQQRSDPERGEVEQDDRDEPGDEGERQGPRPADRLGAIEKGRIANVIVTRGGLFDEPMTIAHVFVAGRQVAIEPPAPRGEYQTR